MDGPENSSTPSGWDIEMFPDEQFSNHVKTYEMPHTATVSVRPTLSLSFLSGYGRFSFVIRNVYASRCVTSAVVRVMRGAVTVTGREPGAVTAVWGRERLRSE